VPRSQDTAFERIRIGFGKAGLEAMELRDQFGQMTVIKFASISAIRSCPRGVPLHAAQGRGRHQ
jgi:outer membrane lipoprotein carrier protein